MADNPLWKLENISKSAPAKAGMHPARLAKTTLEIPSGSTVLLGLSGAGKTTLLNILAGFEKTDTGNITGVQPEQCAWSPQSEGLWPNDSVREHLTLVGASHADPLLETFDLMGVSARLPHQLSHGERSRLCVARALAMRKSVLILDEPLAHVDSARAHKYWAEIQRAVKGGTSLVFSTHDPAFALSHAQHAICLDAGTVVYSGPLEQLYHAPTTPELMQLLGPGNWLDMAQCKRWLNHETDTPLCLRPAQIQIQPDDAGGMEILSSRFYGSCTESEILREDQRRTFVHQPDAPLKAGSRVSFQFQPALRLICQLLLMVLCILGGCKPASPELKNKTWNTWLLPNEGPIQPTPRSIAIGPNNQIAVLDTAGRVLIYNQQAQLQRQWKMLDVQFGKPEGLVWLKDNRIVVCDTHYFRIVWFDLEGKILKTVGSRGRGPGQFEYPVAICVDPAENLYVGEYGGFDRIQKFTREGEWISAFGSHGTRPGQFQRPSGLAWRAGEIFVADAVNNRIHRFTDSGKYLGLLGNPQELGLSLPYDISLGNDDLFYVIEYGTGRLTRLTLEGKLAGRFGKTGGGDGEFSTPWGLAVDTRNRVWVADTKNRRLVLAEF